MRAQRGPVLVGMAAALGLPALFYVAALPGHAGLGMGADRLATGLLLQPGDYGSGAVSALLAHLATLVPIGPLALRVALVPALAVAAALAACLPLGLRLSKPTGAHPGVVVPLSVGLGWFAAGTPALFQLARGATPGAVGLATALWALERGLAAQAGRARQRAGPKAGAVGGPTRVRTATTAAALLSGLTLAEAPGMGVTLLVALLSLSPLVARRSRRSLALAALLLGLCPLLALGLRSGTAWLALTAATTPTATGVGVFGLVLVGTGLVGAVVGLRHGAGQGDPETTWRGGWVPTVTPVFGLFVAAGALYAIAGGQSHLGQTLAPLMVLAGTVLSCPLPLALVPHGERTTGLQRALLTGLAAAAAALGYAQLHAASQAARTGQSPLSDRLCEQAVRNLPARAVVLTESAPATGLVTACLAEEATRPDVFTIAMPRMVAASRVASAIADEPSLAPLLRAYLLAGHLGTAELQTVAARRPILLELRAEALDELAETLRPSGVLYEVVPDGVTTADERGGAEIQQQRYADLVKGIDRRVLTAAERRFLRQRYRLDAAYYDRFEDVESATAAEDRARALE